MIAKTQTLPVRLTTEEKLQRGTALAKALQDCGALESDFAEIKSKFKARIETAELEVSKLGAIVRAGEEFREVAVEDVSDFERSVISTMRLDTGEVVSTRGMTAHERQQHLFDEGEKEPAAKKPAKAADKAH